MQKPLLPCPTCRVVKIDTAPPLCGQVQDTSWSRAEAISIDNYPWYESGGKQATVARLLYDAGAVYVQFLCEDRHIFSQAETLNGPVWEDSCVEFFANPDPQDGPRYFNLEINCCGVMLMGYGQARDSRADITPALVGRIEIVTSVAGPTKDESPDDDGWWAAVALPFDVIGELAGRDIHPASGTVWRANFYRCGGRTDPQHACWSPIDVPQPNLHLPEFFGELLFD